MTTPAIKAQLSSVLGSNSLSKKPPLIFVEEAASLLRLVLICGGRRLLVIVEFKLYLLNSSLAVKLGRTDLSCLVSSSVSFFYISINLSDKSQTVTFDF